MLSTSVLWLFENEEKIPCHIRDEKREEPTSLTLEYFNHVNSRTEKLRLCAQRAIGTLEHVVTCKEETSIVIEEERKKRMKGADIIHERIILYIQKYNKSIKKLTQENNQRRKIEINKLRNENWDRSMEYMKNVKTNIHYQYKTQLDENAAINTELRNELAEVTDRFQTDKRKIETENLEKYKEDVDRIKQQLTERYNSKIEESNAENKKLREKLNEINTIFQTDIKKIETENWTKYKEEVDKIQQQLTERCNSKIEESNAVTNRLREKLNEIHTIVLPRLEKNYQQSVYQVEKTVRQDYQTHVQDMKNKSDVAIQELKRENLTLRTYDNRQNVEKQTYISTIKELESSNQRLIEKNIELDELDKKRTQQMQQEFTNMRLSLDELRKENDMLNATVEEKISENLSSDKKIKELTTKFKDKERSTDDKYVETLQTTICKLRKELLDNHILMHQAKETLSRSKSLCDVSHSPEEIKMRTKLIQRSVKETDEEMQQKFDDQADYLYESTGKRHSLQSLTRNLENNARFQKEETEKYNPDPELTEREMTSEYDHDHLSKVLKTRSSQNPVQNTYNIINSRAIFHDSCVVKNLEAISATTNSNPSITNE